MEKNVDKIANNSIKKRVKLEVAYDGTNYCGWQIQKNGITVQEVLNVALSDLLGEDVKTMGASRTDAGVHALANVAVFDTDRRMPADRMSFALNQRLPEDIRVVSSMEVESDFHPRYTKTIKTYEYRILNRTFDDPVRRLYSFHCYQALDLNAMKEAAGYFCGTHDFVSFCSDTKDVLDTTRTIYETRLWKEEDMIYFRITGNGFLYNMVRIIVGTLLDVGKGRISPSGIEDILAAKDRKQAGPTARAKGLTLVKIRYPDYEV